MSHNQEPSVPVLIQDLGTQYYGNKSKKVRFGLYECPICKKHYKTQCSAVKFRKSTKCKSCSASQRSFKHGLSSHPIKKSWNMMIDRVTNKNNPRYERYLGRGITICEEWRNDFMSFYNWSMDNGWESGLSIDRINNDGNYEPSNCRWTNCYIKNRNTTKIRRSNKSGYRGVGIHLKTNKWRSRIFVDRKEYFLGLFDDPKHAAMAYDTFVIVYGLQHITNFPKGIFQ